MPAGNHVGGGGLNDKYRGHRPNTDRKAIRQHGHNGGGGLAGENRHKGSRSMGGMGGGGGSGSQESGCALTTCYMLAVVLAGSYGIDHLIRLVF